MSTRRTRLAATTASLGASALVGAAPAQALSYDPDRWDAGNIISDANFYDGGGMSVSEIRSFLESMAPSTCPSIASTATPCLVDARDDIRSRSADAACGSIAADANEPVERVIAVVAKACNISPQVLLVTLQKEQALVTSADPSDWAYDHAMGWGCPDSAPCETTYNGLFNQLYMGAKQFQNYRIYSSSFSYRKGQTASIAFSPDSSCGSTSVTIENWATAALYNYTPYTPNQGALDNYPGTAPCGSYGNRNFWANYNSWFGSSITGGYFLRTEDSDDEFLAVGDVRYRIDGSSKQIKNAYAPFKPSGTVSTHYLKSFEHAGAATQILLSGGGVYYLVDRGKRFRLEGDCDQAVDIGFSCDELVAMEKPELDLLERKKLGDTVKTNEEQPSRFALFNGRKHEYADKEALEQAGLPHSTRSTLSTGTLKRIDIGRTVVGEGDLVRASDGTHYWRAGDVLWRIETTLWDQTGLSDWLGEPVRSGMRSDGLERHDPPALPTAFTDADTGEAWLLDSDGRVAVDATGWAEAPVTVPHEFVRALPDTGRSVGTEFFASKKGSSRILLVEHGVKREVADERARALIALDRGLPDKSPSYPDDTIAGLGAGALAHAPGTAVRTDADGRLVVVSRDRAVPAKKVVQRAVLGTDGVLDLTGRDAEAIEVRTTPLTPGIECDGVRYATLDGVLRPMSTADSKEWMPVFGFGAQSEAFCASLDEPASGVGQAVRLPDGDKYRIENGERHKMSKDVYRALREEIGVARAISQQLLDLFPSGGREQGA